MVARPRRQVPSDVQWQGLSSGISPRTGAPSLLAELTPADDLKFGGRIVTIRPLSFETRARLEQIVNS
jgi:hypothetical protein